MINKELLAKFRETGYLPYLKHPSPSSGCMGKTQTSYNICGESGNYDVPCGSELKRELWYADFNPDLSCPYIGKAAIYDPKHVKDVGAAYRLIDAIEDEGIKTQIREDIVAGKIKDVGLDIRDIGLIGFGIILLILFGIWILIKGRKR